MSRRIKKIKKKAEDIHYKNFNEILEILAVLKCLEYTCLYCDDDDILTISDVEAVIRVIQQKMHVIAGCIDSLSLI